MSGSFSGANYQVPIEVDLTMITYNVKKDDVGAVTTTSIVNNFRSAYSSVENARDKVILAVPYINGADQLGNQTAGRIIPSPDDFAYGATLIFPRNILFKKLFDNMSITRFYDGTDIKQSPGSYIEFVFEGLPSLSFGGYRHDVDILMGVKNLANNADKFNNWLLADPDNPPSNDSLFASFRNDDLRDIQVYTFNLLKYNNQSETNFSQDKIDSVFNRIYLQTFRTILKLWVKNPFSTESGGPPQAVSLALGELTNTNALVDGLGAGEDGHVLTWNNTAGHWEHQPPAGLGEANTASNLAAEGIFAQKNLEDLEFKGLTSTGGNVAITSTATTVDLNVTFPPAATTTLQDDKVTDVITNPSTNNLDGQSLRFDSSLVPPKWENSYYSENHFNYICEGINTNVPSARYFTVSSATPSDPAIQFRISVVDGNATNVSTELLVKSLSSGKYQSFYLQEGESRGLRAYYSLQGSIILPVAGYIEISNLTPEGASLSNYSPNNHYQLGFVLNDVQDHTLGSHSNVEATVDSALDNQYLRWGGKSGNWEAGYIQYSQVQDTPYLFGHQYFWRIGGPSLNTFTTGGIHIDTVSNPNRVYISTKTNTALVGVDMQAVLGTEIIKPNIVIKWYSEKKGTILLPTPEKFAYAIIGSTGLTLTTATSGDDWWEGDCQAFVTSGTTEFASGSLIIEPDRFIQHDLNSHTDVDTSAIVVNEEPSIKATTSNTWSGYTSSASTALFQPYNAFNGLLIDNPATNPFWVSAQTYDQTSGNYLGAVTLGGFTGEWLKIQLPTGFAIGSYQLYGRYVAGGVEQNPRRWAILGSNDDIAWTTIDDKTSSDYTLTDWTNASFSPTFSASSGITYTYYAIVVESTQPSNGIRAPAVLEWKLYSDIGDLYLYLDNGIWKPKAIESSDIAADYFGGHKYQFVADPATLVDTFSYNFGTQTLTLGVTTQGFSVGPFIDANTTLIAYEAGGSGRYIAMKVTEGFVLTVGPAVATITNIALLIDSLNPNDNTRLFLQRAPVNTIDELTDVDVGGTVSTHYLGWNGVDNWVNRDINLNELSDVSLGVVTTGHFLFHDGATFVNRLPNDGTIKINTGNGLQPTYVGLTTAQAITYASPLGISSFPTSSPPLAINGGVFVDADIYDFVGNKFLEQQLTSTVHGGQIHLWRFILNYSNKQSGNSGNITITVSNALSGFQAKATFPLPSGVTAENDRYSEAITIADNASKLPAVGGLGSGYSFTIESSTSVDVTITSIARVAYLYSQRA